MGKIFKAVSIIAGLAAIPGTLESINHYVPKEKQKKGILGFFWNLNAALNESNRECDEAIKQMVKEIEEEKKAKAQKK